MISRKVFDALLENQTTKLSINLLESLGNENKEKYDVFISYSSNDRSYALLVGSKLKELGIIPYIDYLDKTLNPNNVNKETAIKLISVINKCKGILYIHSQNSEISKWCPWELGFGEGIKRQISVLEIYDDESTYEQQYLKMYPYVSYNYCEGNDQRKYFWVHNRNSSGESVILDKFLNGTNP